MYTNMKPLFGSNRGYNYDNEYRATKNEVILFPTNISFVTWAIVIPSGVKAKLECSTFDPNKITDENLDKADYWMDWTLEEEIPVDANNYVTGPRKVMGSLPPVSGIRARIETTIPTANSPVMVGVRAQ